MTPYIGMISTFGFGFAPKNWAQCNGQLLAISTNQALFSILGTTYGGDGRTTFALPDMRGRTAVSWGTSTTGTYYSLGEAIGTEKVTLLTGNMPAHTHQASLSLNASDSATGVKDDPSNDVFAPAASGIGNLYNTAPTPNVSLGGVSIQVGTSGASQPITILNPYVVVNYCIALAGIFPSRN